MKPISQLGLCLGFALIPGLAVAELDFYRDIYPFLKTNCVSCHNKTTTKAGLNMETPELMIKGGDNGPSIVPGDSSKSLLVEASAHSDFIEMPPSKNKTGARPLNGAELAKLKQWIDEGAKSSTQEVRQVVWQALSAEVDPIYSVAMTDDGRYVACGRGNRIFVYDLALRSLVGEVSSSSEDPSAHRALVNSLAFSPGGSRLASGSFREVKIWKKTQTPASTRKADPALGIVSATSLPDGKQIVAADKTGTVIVIDSASGKVVRKIEKAATGKIAALSVSPDGKKLALVSSPWNLRIWSLPDGKKIAEQEILDPALDVKRKAAEAKEGEEAEKTAADLAAAVAKSQATATTAFGWSGDGKSILTATADNQIRVWPLPAPGAAFAAPKLLTGAVGVTGFAAAPNGQFVTCGTDNKITIWNLSDGKIVRQFGAAADCVAVSPDGKSIATGTADGRVRLWSVSEGKQLFDLRGTPQLAAKIADLQKTIDREKLEQTFQKARAAAITARDKGLVDLLKKAKDAVVAMNKKLPEAKKAIPPLKEARVAAEKNVVDAETALKTPPEGKTVKVLESELEKAKVALLTAETKENDAVAALAAFESNITDAQANQKKITETQAANAKEVAAAQAAEAEAKKRETEATTALTAAKKEAAAIGPKPLALVFSNDSTRIAASCVDGSIRAWTVNTGTPIENTAGTAIASASLVARADGSFFSVSGSGVQSSTASNARWKLEQVLGGEEQPDLFADRVESVTFSPDGKILATGGGEPSRSGDITLFDVASNRVEPSRVKSTWKECHADSVISLDFSPDGKRLASGAADKIARIYEVETGKQVNLFEGHTHYVNDVAFRSDGRVLATAGGDGVVNSWDLTIGERKKKIEGWTKEVTSLEFIGATDRIVTSAGDNLVRIVTDAGSQVRAISKLPDFMQAAASTADGKMIVAGGEDSFLRVWNGADGKEIIAFGMQ